MKKKVGKQCSRCDADLYTTDMHIWNLCMKCENSSQAARRAAATRIERGYHVAPISYRERLADGFRLLCGGEL